MSELRSSIGKGEVELQRILLQLTQDVQLSGRDTYVRDWGRFDKRQLPVRCYPDALVDSPVFGSGVFLVQGSIHSTRAHARLGGKDDRARDAYERHGLWVEEITPSEARDFDSVKAALERHRIHRDDYGGEI